MVLAVDVADLRARFIKRTMGSRSGSGRAGPGAAPAGSFRRHGCRDRLRTTSRNPGISLTSLTSELDGAGLRTGARVRRCELGYAWTNSRTKRSSTSTPAGSPATSPTDPLPVPGLNAALPSRLNNVHSLPDLVAAGLGIALVPHSFVDTKTRARFVPLDPPLPQWRAAVAVAAGRSTQRRGSGPLGRSTPRVAPGCFRTIRLSTDSQKVPLSHRSGLPFPRRAWAGTIVGCLVAPQPASRGDVRQDQDGSMSGEISPTGKRSGPGSSPELRASHADRDRVVDVLRIAAGDGLLTADELDERLEAALSARTLSELAALTADLPPASATAGGTGAEVKDVVRIEQVHSGAVERVGRWVVPRRLELAVTYCEVMLDFTDAVITHDTLRIDVGMTGKTLTLVTRPGIVVDIDALQLVHSRVKYRHTPTNPDTPVTLRVELVGQKAHGRVVVRPPRRTFGQWLLRRPASPRTGH